MHVVVHEEIKSSDLGLSSKSSRDLCFQKVTYVESEAKKHSGFRFMYRDEKGRLLAQKGQAKIPNIATAKALISTAEAKGW